MDVTPAPHNDDSIAKEEAAVLDSTGSATDFHVDTVTPSDHIERAVPSLKSPTEETDKLDTTTDKIMMIKELSPPEEHVDTEDHDFEKLLLEIKKSTGFETSSDRPLPEKDEGDDTKASHELDSKYLMDVGEDIESVVESAVLDELPELKDDPNTVSIKTGDLPDVHSELHSLGEAFDSITADTKLPDTIDLKSDVIDPDALSNILGLDSKNEESIFSTSELLDTNLSISDVASKTDISKISESLDRELKLEDSEGVIHTEADAQQTNEKGDKVPEENCDHSSISLETKNIKTESDTTSKSPSNLVKDHLPASPVSSSNLPSTTQTINTAVPIADIKSPTLHNEIESLPISTKMELDPCTPKDEYETGKDIDYPKSEAHEELIPSLFHRSELQSMHDGQITQLDALNNSTSMEIQLKNDQHKSVPTDNVLSMPHEQPTIFAYARLDFQSFTFYVQTLHAIIGRKSENDHSYKVDVNLGPSKSISRRHAQIFYNFGTRRFELSVIGKNGAFVDDKFVERGKTVPLRNKTKIQIGQIPFRFILPDQEKVQSSEPHNGTIQELQHHQQQQQQIGNNGEVEIPKIEELEDKGMVAKVEDKGNKATKKKKSEKKDTIHKGATAKSRATKSEQRKPTSESNTTTSTTAPTTKKSRKTNAATKAKADKKVTTSTTTKEVRTAKPPNVSYPIDEIPAEYRVKPPLSYSSMLITCLRRFSNGKGMSLSEIYSGIRELHPYYKYCRDGWQSSVRHNLSLNKSFKKISKEGKGWLWGLDEEYIAEREQQKQQQAEAAKAKAGAAHQQHQQSQQQTGGKTGSVGKQKATTTKKQTISQTLAANRSSAAAAAKTKESDHQRTIKYLQEELIMLTRDRKGLSKQVIANILTQALAMTINQVSQAAKNKSIVGNPLTVLMDKNPQHLNLILAAAVNAATAKVTNGKVKQLVSTPTLESLQRKTLKSKSQEMVQEEEKKKKEKEKKGREVKKPRTETVKRSNTSRSQTKQTTRGSTTSTSTTRARSSTSSSTRNTPNTTISNNNTTTTTAHHPTFDPTSLSRFFQPKQQQRAPKLSRSNVTVTATTTSSVESTASTSTRSKGRKKVIPKKRGHESTDSSDDSSSSSSSSSSSGSSSSSEDTDSSDSEDTTSSSASSSTSSSECESSSSSGSSSSDDNTSDEESSSSDDEEDKPSTSKSENKDIKIDKGNNSAGTGSGEGGSSEGSDSASTSSDSDNDNDRDTNSNGNNNNNNKNDKNGKDDNEKEISVSSKEMEKEGKVESNNEEMIEMQVKETEHVQEQEQEEKKEGNEGKDSASNNNNDNDNDDSNSNSSSNNNNNNYNCNNNTDNDEHTNREEVGVIKIAELEDDRKKEASDIEMISDSEIGATHN